MKTGNRFFKVLLLGMLLLSLIFTLGMEAAADEFLPEEYDEEKDEEGKDDEDAVEVMLLDDIIVLASRHPEKVMDAKVSADVVSAEEISEEGAKSVAEVLSEIEGVSIKDNGGVSGLKSISIRGSRANQVLVMIDGQPVNNIQNGQVDLSLFPIENIERIEVVRGAASALYGANALGGVVNIITKTGSKKPVTGVEASIGSFNTQKFTLTHDSSLDRTDINLAASWLKSDGHRTNSDLNQINLSAKMNYRIDNASSLLVSVQYNDAEKGIPGANLPFFLTPAARQYDTTMSLHMKWTMRREDADTAVVLYKNSHTTVYDNPEEFGYDGPSSHFSGRTGAGFSTTRYIADNILTYGFDIQGQYADSNEIGKHASTDYALYFQGERPLFGGINGTFGARYDHHQVFGSVISPNVGVQYSVSPNLNVYATVGKAYSTPTYNDLYWPPSPWDEGNPNLKPETGIASGAGVRYAGNGVSGEVAVFYNKVQDLISWAEGEDGKWRPTNINSAAIKGFELDFERELGKGFSFEMNYTYLDSKDLATGKQLDPKHDMDLSLNFSHDATRAELGCRLLEGRENGLDGFVLFDVTLTHSFRLKGTKYVLSVGIDNIFDEEYEINKDYPMPGRTVTLGLKTAF